MRSSWALAKEEKGKAVATRRETNLGTKGKVCACVHMCILSKSTYSRQSFLMKLTEKK
jgi:hypothetical protein